MGAFAAASHTSGMPARVDAPGILPPFFFAAFFVRFCCSALELKAMVNIPVLFIQGEYCNARKAMNIN